MKPEEQRRVEEEAEKTRIVEQRRDEEAGKYRMAEVKQLLYELTDMVHKAEQQQRA